jgi:type IV pilus assembly protein PilP
VSYGRFLVILVSCMVLAACEKSSHQDVKDFIAESKRKQPGKIKPLPLYAPYKPHVYDPAGLRSPFEPPAVVQKKVLAAKSNVKPDLDRSRQRLEQFEFSTLRMVGSIKKDGVIWGLIRDPEGSIERVKEGYYLGKNHGRIVSLTEQKADIIEIVPNGLNGWLERPNIIMINNK